MQPRRTQPHRSELPMHHPPQDRRTFLEWAINGIGAVFAIILGAPIVAYLIDPRNRAGAATSMKLADGVRLSDFGQKVVQQGTIRDIRRDGWTLYPNDVIGRVWVVLQVDKTIPGSVEERKNLSKDVLKVFTTICPHLGCSVNLNPDGASFGCPCHSAEFHRDGERYLQDGHQNPAARGMDELDWAVDADGERLLVEYKSFKSSVADKIVIG